MYFLYNALADNRMKYGVTLQEYDIGAGSNIYGGYTRKLHRTHDRLWVVQRNPADQSVNLHYSTDSGVTWSGPQNAATLAFNAVFHVDSCVDSLGNVHIAWCARLSADNSRHVYYRKWDRETDSFLGASETLASGAYNNGWMTACGIAVNSSDEVFVGFQCASSTIAGTKSPFGSFVTYGTGIAYMNIAVLGVGDDFHCLYLDRVLIEANLHHIEYDNGLASWSLIDANVLLMPVMRDSWGIIGLDNDMHLAGSTTWWGGRTRYRVYTSGAWGGWEYGPIVYVENVNIGTSGLAGSGNIYMCYWIAGAEQDLVLMRRLSVGGWVPDEVINLATGTDVGDPGTWKDVPGAYTPQVIAVL